MTPHLPSTHILNDRLSDRWRRSVTYLRVSVTDRCNYRCTYCMPPTGWTASPRNLLLSLEELFEVISVMVDLGVKKVRFTGGEPLLRKDLSSLIRKVRALEGVEQIALTTNGHLLGQMAADLYQAGLRRLNISLDTLNPKQFTKITRGGDIERVLRGIEVAEEVGFQDIQINAVLSPETSMTLDDRVNFCEKIWGRGWTPRWIEMMPIGGLKAQMGGESSITVRAHLHEHFDLRPLPSSSAPSPLSSSISGPARYWEVSSGRYQGHRVGFIDPLSDDGFCSTCNRVRLTARGGLRACLADDSEVDLKSPLRAGFTGLLLIPFIEEALYGKRPAHLMTAGELPTMIMTGIGG